VKLALVVPGGVDRSGEYRVIPALIGLFRHLSTHHEVHVFALRQEPAPGRWELAGATIHNIGTDPLWWRALREIRREHLRAPFALTQAIWSGRCSAVALAAARLLRLPCLVHVAGGELVGLPDIGYGGHLSLRGRIGEPVVLRSADVVSAASAPMIASLAKLGIRAETVPLGVDLDTWPVRPPVRRDGGPLRLIQIASLNRVKDQPTLLRAVARLRAAGVPVSLDVVGEDTLGGEMQQLAVQLGVDSCVRFHGYLPHRLLRACVEAAHLCIVSSRHEAGPLALLEAAVAGVPTVGTAVGHVAEWSPQTAQSVPVGDHEALADAIRRLADDEEARLKLASAAQARALAIDAKFTAARFGELYERQARRA
jgi:glycosyltransferase involved in cell wall biosynthesis